MERSPVTQSSKTNCRHLVLSLSINLTFIIGRPEASVRFKDKGMTLNICPGIASEFKEMQALETMEAPCCPADTPRFVKQRTEPEAKDVIAWGSVKAMQQLINATAGKCITD